MRLLVCGGRHFNDREWAYAHLDRYLRDNPALAIACGYNPKDARDQGADQIAYQWAKDRGVHGSCYPAHWGDLEAPGAVVITPKWGGPAYNRAAGPQRNQRMLDAFKPDRVAAFPEQVMGAGTSHMCTIARRAGVAVDVWQAVEVTEDRCAYETPYYGQCRYPREDGSWCVVHSGKKCDSCGAQAVHGCGGWVGSFVCCFPLCDDCEGDHGAAIYPAKPIHRRKLVCSAA